MLVSSGDGTLYLYKYHYPDQRRIKVRVIFSFRLSVVGRKKKGEEVIIFDFYRSLAARECLSSAEESSLLQKDRTLSILCLAGVQCFV